MVRPDPRLHGDISQWPVGLLFADRVDLYDAGVHGTKESGIFGTKGDNGAFSIVLNAGYEDDDDRGDIIIYTGEGKGKPKPGQKPKPGANTQQGPQDMNSSGNAALQKNQTERTPVRVIRGPDGNVKYSPLQGYRYDGLYYVESSYMEEGKAGFKMCKFELRRCDDLGQDPLPLHITGQGPTDKYWSPDGPETLAAKPRRNANASNTDGRTVQQRNKEITGNKKLPKISFRKVTEPASRS
ncbi:PUA-like domain-containing protein [Mycena rosella]|uniref:PUA-like domain-containing protein n=1 Tax=Mycena rosella TaxID=1033263 RepID=A0AAD7DMT6_MYCRO|nr:PUA-like domain-containing protein [Mycena rosella]